MLTHNQEMFQSICWTMVHSLWQGLVLAVLAGMVIVGTRKSTALLRYNLLVSLGVLFVASIIYTFYIQVQQHEPATSLYTQQLAASQDASPVLVTYNHHLQQQRQTVMGSVAGFFDRYAMFIVGIWFTVLVFKCLSLIKGLLQVHRIKHTGISPVTPYLNLRLENLKDLLGIKVPVKLLESALVKTPVVIGYFKPVILMPLGLLANMPSGQAEAILLHELSHIRRKDYLVNMLQNIAEMIFFFNPGLLWLSSLMRTERENCCDDMALAFTQNKTGFVHALVFSQEYGEENKLALGFGQKKTPLLNRAKRILHNDNQSLNNMEKTFLSVCIVLGLSVAFAFTGIGQVETKNKVEHSPVAETKETIKYSESTFEHLTEEAPLNESENYPGQHLPEGAFMHYTEEVNGVHQPVYIFKHEGVVYQASGDVRELRVNGQVIPQENWAKYMPLVEEMISSYRDRLNDDLTEPGEYAPGVPVPAIPAVAPYDPGVPAPPAPPAPPVPAYYYRGDDSLRKKEIEAEQKKLSVEMQKLSEEIRKMEKEMARTTKKADKEMMKAEMELKKAEIEMRKAEMEMEKANMEMERANMEMARAEGEMEKVNEDVYPYKAMNTELQAELKKSTGKISSYMLGKKELIVNGKKQPADLHQRLSKKYLTGKITVMYYNYTTNIEGDEMTITGFQLED